MNAPHFDDESLSAALDSDERAVAAHLAECGDCRSRSEALAGAARAVASGTGPGLTAERADQAVGAALAAFDAERAAGGRPTSAAQDVSTVVPLRRPAPAAGASISETRRRPPAWVLGVAAALAAVLVAVPVISSLNSDNGDETAAAPVERSASGLADAAGGASVLDGGDLGEQADQLALGSLVATALGEETAAPLPAGPTDSQAAAAAEAQRAGEAAGGPTIAAAPAPADTSASTFSEGDDAAPPGADPDAVAACEEAAATQFGDRLGTQVYRATLRWRGTPAVVLAYKVEGATGALDHQAIVMALSGCEILVSQGF